MRKTAFLKLIRHGENSKVVFRPDTITNDVLATEVSALLNLQGGLLILGVEDDGSVAGIARDRPEEWVMTACRDKIRSELIPYYEIIRDAEPGKDVTIIQVDRG